jgi:glycosyltransferase involved in cell wall biosynthesis
MATFGWRVWRGPLSKRLKRPDVIVGSSPHLLAALAGQRLARKLGCASVFEVRDLWPESLVQLDVMSTHHPFVIVARALERMIAKGSDMIVTVMPNAVDYLDRLGIPRDRVSWVSNGVELAGRQLAARPPVHEDRGEFCFVYAGAHGPPNELDSLLDAAAILMADERARAIRFDLYGTGVEKSRLVARAMTEGLTNVRFHAPVPKTEIPAILEAASALILLIPPSPLYRYGVSMNKVFDYLAAGRPILIATSAWNNPVADADAGLSVPPGDAPALAERAIEMAAWSDQMLAEAGRRGRAHVAANYDFAALAERFETVLKRAMTVNSGS